jgi:hypothetical protein
MSEPTTTSDVTPTTDLAPIPTLDTVHTPIIEPSVNISNIVVETGVVISNELIQLLQEHIKLPSYQLTQDQQDWIQLLIKNSPDSFAKINNDIKTIFSLDSVGVQNIPQIIQLCADIFNSASSQSGIANSVNIYVLIKIILDILLESSLVSLPSVEKATLKSLVDISLGLLTTSLSNSQSVPVVSANRCCV